MNKNGKMQIMIIVCLLVSAILVFGGCGTDSNDVNKTSETNMNDVEKTSETELQDVDKPTETINQIEALQLAAGDVWHGISEDLWRAFPQKLIQTITAYYESFLKGRFDESLCDQGLYETWIERYSKGKTLPDTDSFDASLFSLERILYLDEDLFIGVVVSSGYEHYIRAELRNEAWYITNDIGNASYYDRFGSSGETTENTFLEEARALVKEAYEKGSKDYVIPEENILMIAENALFDMPLLSYPVSGEERENAMQKAVAVIEKQQAYEYKLIDWIISNQYFNMENLPAVCVHAYLEDHKPISITQDDEVLEYNPDVLFLFTRRNEIWDAAIMEFLATE